VLKEDQCSERDITFADKNISNKGSIMYNGENSWLMLSEHLRE
jgi:hypothetical protein